VSETIEYVNPKELKPDLNQPRKYFNKEEIEQLAQTFDAQDIINPIEVDESNFIILGERRWRGAIKKGLDKIPIRRKIGLSKKTRLERQLIDDAHREDLNEMEKAWAYGTAILNINTDGNYTIEDVKAMNQNTLINLLKWNASKVREGIPSGTAQLSRIIGVNQMNIWNYVQCLFLERETQAMIGRGDGKIPYTYARVIARLHPKYPEAQTKVEKMLREGMFKKGEDLESYVKSFLGEVEEKVEKEAEKVIRKGSKVGLPKIEPSKEVVEEETKKRVKKKKTILEKALCSLSDAEKKIAKAKKLGIDVSEFVGRFERIKIMVSSDPKIAWEEGRQLKKDLDNSMKPEEEKAKEERLRKKLRDEERTKLLADEELQKQMAKLFEGKENDEKKEGEKSELMKEKMSKLEVLKKRGVIPYTIWDFPFRDNYGGDRDFHGNCSPQIVEQCIWRLTEEGNLVIDPMAGSGTTLDVCNLFNRKCIAYDLNPRENRRDIIQNDSRKIPLEDESVDMIFIHPPYWDMVSYTEAKEENSRADLSRAKSLDEFVDMLREVFGECFRVLKKGKFMCALLGDKIKDGRYIPICRKSHEVALKIGFSDYGHAIKVAHGEMSRQKSGVIVAESVYTDHLKLSHDLVMFFRKGLE